MDQRSVGCRGGLGYRKRSNVVRDWLLLEAEGRWLLEMGLPLVVVCPDQFWGPSLWGACVVAALQAAASPCARAIDWCSHAHAKSLHALWPIRAPAVRLLQSERDLPAAPFRLRELSSRLTGQKRSLGLFGASRYNTHASRNTTFKGVLFQYNSPSPIFVFGHRAIFFWD